MNTETRDTPLVAAVKSALILITDVEVWNALQQGLTDQGHRDQANADLLDAAKAMHEAIDRLFAQLIVNVRGFMPSRSGQPWEAVGAGVSAINAVDDSWGCDTAPVAVVKEDLCTQCGALGVTCCSNAQERLRTADSLGRLVDRQGEVLEERFNTIAKARAIILSATDPVQALAKIREVLG